LEEAGFWSARCPFGVVRVAHADQPARSTTRNNPLWATRHLLHDINSTQVHLGMSMRYRDNADGKIKRARISNAAAGAHLGPHSLVYPATS
jgi:hypothetical protein